MEEIVINTIEWQAKEYNHKERNPDWFWTIGLVTLVTLALAIWFKNYLFALFLLISGACLILFTIRRPQEVKFTINNEGLIIGNKIHVWKELKGFNIKKNKTESKLLIETKKYFLPIHTIPLPDDKVQNIMAELSKVLPSIETLDESQSVQLMEKLGF